MGIIGQIKPKSFTFIDWFLPLFMILAQYRIGGTFSNYGFAILIAYGVFILLVKRQVVYINRYLLHFTIYITFITVVNTIRLGGFSMYLFNSTIIPIILIVTISAVINKLDFENFYKSYLFFGSISMIIMYFQSIGLLVFGIPAIPITILPIAPEDAHFWGNFLGERPSGLFTEPQAYASFMIPLLVMTLIKGKQSLGSLISFSILLSTSSQGILMVGIIYLYFILLGKAKRIQKVFLTIVILFSIYALLNFKIFEFATNKISKTDVENDIRLTRGFVVYATFNLTDILLGINNNLENYIYDNLNVDWVNQVVQLRSEKSLGYTTTISGVLIQYGLIAGILFFLMIYKMYKYEDPNNRIFLLIIIILSFSQTLLFNAWFVFYYTIYWGLCNKKLYNNNYLYLKL